MKLNDMVPLADLVAQFSMAHSAHVMLGLSALQLLVGVAGTFALVWTIRQAQRSQHLAESAIQLQREMSQRELRSYLGVKISEISSDFNEVKAILEIKNTGNTPGTVQEISFGSVIVSFPFEDEPTLIKTSQKLVLSKDQTLRMPVAATWDGSRDSRSKLKFGEKYDAGTLMYIRMEIHYSDVFGQKHFTKFGVQCAVNGTEFSIIRYAGQNCI